MSPPSVAGRNRAFPGRRPPVRDGARRPACSRQSPVATAHCTVNTLNWCTLRNSAIRAAGAEHVADLPAGDVVGLAEARHHDAARRQFGCARTGWRGARHRTRCVRTPRRTGSRYRCRAPGRPAGPDRQPSSRLPVGLCGELTMIIRVRGVDQRRAPAPSPARSPGSSKLARAPPCPDRLDRRHIGVIDRLEDDHLVARPHEGRDGGEEGLRRPGGDGDLRFRIVARAVQRLPPCRRWPARSSGIPAIGAYWLRPASIWRCTASNSTGSAWKSGKPCDRLIAPHSWSPAGSSR